ncbi:MAG: terminase small subunit [Clostridia bacterium]|nr:terminase small subunit [Clostridia bacterium]
MSLTKKEIEFCRYFAICRDARESAAQAGFAVPERSGMRLLAKDSIISEIERISQKNTTVTSAVDGLKRIAFGSVADAVRLILEPEAVDTEKLDLFMVSELKCTDKCIEIKFFDRIKALTALLDVSSMSEDNTTSQFVDAIFKGASAIEGVGSLSDEL